MTSPIPLETVALPHSSANTTRIGFGCSNLLGDKTRAEGLALLHAAYDAGVRHFDVARVYNFGDAEALLGEFAAGRRDQITITTKFGLMPRAGVARMRGPVQFVRRLMRSSTFIRNLVRRNVSTLTKGGSFDVPTARLSLETSLRTLRTDFIDIYLMHEPSLTDCTDEIMEFLLQARAEGKIGAFGCGTGYERIPDIAAGRPEFLEVAQFESGLLQQNRQAFRAVRPQQTLMTITHGAMGSTAAIQRSLTADDGLARLWSDRLGFDVLQGATLYGLVLQQAVLDNSGGIVLFRASTPERVRQSLTASQEVPLTFERSNALLELVVLTMR
jgi:aryl-alcohol dehydrogenase-like predicted oxidoreductase